MSTSAKHDQTCEKPNWIENLDEIEIIGDTIVTAIT